MRYTNGGYIGYAPTPSVSGELDGIWRYTDVTKNVRNNNWHVSTIPSNARISPSSVVETTGTSITLTCLFDNDLSGFLETFQWQTSLNNSIWTNISGQNNSTLIFSMASGDNNTYRRCKIDRGFKSVFATPAEIYVALNTITISLQPDNLTLYAGEAGGSFTVAASIDSEATINYQWQVSTDGGSSWSNAPGTSTNASYSVTPPPYSSNGYKYRCYLTAIGATPATSNEATLTVENVTIVITDQPDGNSCQDNSSPTFTVQAYIYPIGTLSYEWYKSLNSDGSWSLITNSDTGFTQVDSGGGGYSTSTLTIDCTTQSSNLYLKCRVYWSIIETYSNTVIYDATEYNPFI